MATTTAISQSESTPRRHGLLPVMVLIGRVALGLVFVYAAYSKFYFNGAWHFGDYHFFFGMLVDSYHILPDWGVQLMARYLPWVEIAIGVFLIAGIGARWAGAFASTLLGVFIVAMARAKYLGLEINCGCFGNNEKLGTATLIRDSAFLVFALAVTIGAFVVKKRRTIVSS
jgi:uncharacterized membrane protein YphA (DoxX/SURF4 family)